MELLRVRMFCKALGNEGPRYIKYAECSKIRNSTNDGNNDDFITHTPERTPQNKWIATYCVVLSSVCLHRSRGRRRTHRCQCLRGWVARRLKHKHSIINTQFKTILRNYSSLSKHKRQQKITLCINFTHKRQQKINLCMNFIWTVCLLFVSDLVYWTRRYKPSVAPFVPQTVCLFMWIIMKGVYRRILCMLKP